ncbi:Activator of 90 kDa heat shock protein ATPase 1 [Fasciola gigantica]|uniref:Activator of 90 kDa heat shock protein ATPase 1 n=1 Tax=Fasciola gigantica TaxID=46835 RepID=A0A504YIQ4_FASGI|nr:Activator of 90 kDa heat shock protein ATPase 1 [Fasciola gigantica]
MAKWGEGDPRWIVEERGVADATNVNNWHWTEKNATSWSVDLIKRLLLSLKVENDDFVCSIVDVTKCDGEAHVNNRKGKLIFLYEWHIEADWTGKFPPANELGFAFLLIRLPHKLNFQ